jgi:hypothetical protein
MNLAKYSDEYYFSKKIFIFSSNYSQISLKSYKLKKINNYITKYQILQQMLAFIVSYIKIFNFI